MTGLSIATPPRSEWFPIGSIYISVNITSPASLFGGTWERIAQGRMLLGMGAIEENHNSYWGTVSPGEVNPEYAGEMGGEAWHKLTTNEIPGHQHGPITIGTDGVNIVHWLSNSQSNSKDAWGFTYDTEMSGNELYSGYAGGGAAHNNMPPYLAVYMWKRVS